MKFNLSLVAIAALVGFVGDALLQIMVEQGMGGKTGWGLKEYFSHQGRAEALFTAAGMMAIFYAIYMALNLPLTVPCLAVYGIVLDLLFRKLRIFPSLDGYYKALNVFWSGVWGAIPMVLPLVIFQWLNKQKINLL